MNRTLNLCFIFYYNLINIQVLLIIRALIILKYFSALDFEYYIYIYVERERERERERQKNWRLGCIYIYVERERETF